MSRWKVDRLHACTALLGREQCMPLMKSAGTTGMSLAASHSTLHDTDQQQAGVSRNQTASACPLSYRRECKHDKHPPRKCKHDYAHENANFAMPLICAQCTDTSTVCKHHPYVCGLISRSGKQRTMQNVHCVVQHDTEERASLA